MSTYKRIAIESVLMDEIAALAREETHISDLAEGRCIEWLHGEYKRLKLQVAAEKSVKTRSAAAKK